MIAGHHFYAKQHAREAHHAAGVIDRGKGRGRQGNSKGNQDGQYLGTNGLLPLLENWHMMKSIHLPLGVARVPVFAMLWAAAQHINGDR